MNRTHILVGIVTRNRADILPKALASVVTQTAHGVRLAVLDDGSSDATPCLRERFPQAHWIRWEANRGLIVARNHLMNCADADYYVSLDDDAWFLRGDEIALAVDHLKEDRSAAAVAFDILSADRSESATRKSAETASMFIGCGHVLRLAAVREVGAYELTPGSYGGEEKDLCLRLMDAGYRIVRLPGLHVWHDKTPVARDIPDQHRSGVCNDLAMTLRRTPLALLPAALPVKFYRHFRFAWQHKLIRPCWQGFGLFVRSIPSLLGSRKPVRIRTLRAFSHLSHV